MHSELVTPSSGAPEEVVRRLGAMQAQEYAPAKWSIGQRALSLHDDDVERAVRSGEVVRTHVLRPTWHFVARDDIRRWLALTGPRVRQRVGHRFRQLSLDNGTLTRCRKLLVAELAGGRRMRRDEIGDLLDRARIDPAGQRLPYILLHCELDQAICSGGLDGKRHTYAHFDERVPPDKRFDRDEALVEFTRRYLSSHGPATVKDLGWWSSLTMKDIRSALHMLGKEVHSETIDGITLWSMAAARESSAKPRGVHLLQPFDEIIVGYTESRFFRDSRAAEARAAWTDGAGQRGLVLMNGMIAGRWRHTIRKDSMTVEAVMYDEPTPSTARAIKAATAELGRFVGLPTKLETSRFKKSRRG